MQVEKPTQLYKQSILTLPKTLLINIIAFLNLEDLKSLATLGHSTFKNNKNQKNQQHKNKQ